MNTTEELKIKIDKIEEVLSSTFLFEESNREKKIIKREYKTKKSRISEIYLKVYIGWNFLDSEDLLLSLEVSTLGELIDYKLLIDKNTPEKLFELINNI